MHLQKVARQINKQITARTALRKLGFCRHRRTSARKLPRPLRTASTGQAALSVDNQIITMLLYWHCPKQYSDQHGAQ